MKIKSNKETKSSREELEELVVFDAKMVPQSKHNMQYATSRKKKIYELLSRGVFI